MENNIMNNEVVEQATEQIVENTGRFVPDFKTGVGVGLVASVLTYGAVKIGGKLLKKYKDKKAEENSTTETEAAKTAEKVVEGEVVTTEKK